MPKLFVVATPIGNLQDMSPRAVDTLKNVGLIAAEDTRVTMKLCQVFDIHTPLTSCHQHNEESKGAWLAEKMLEENIDVAVTTDAGTPCVSDPGYGLVKAAVERGIEVIPVPGCCAAVAALSVSGFDTREFAFFGFLPREKKDLREKLIDMARKSTVAVVHESPYRVTELVENIAAVLPETRISASCDLTKLHEKTIRGRADEVLAEMKANPKTEKGEYCLVLDFHEVQLPAQEQPVTDVSLEAQLTDLLLSGMDWRDAQTVLTDRGNKKNAVKAAALRLKKLLTEEE